MDEIYGIVKFRPIVKEGTDKIEELPVLQSPFFFVRDYEIKEYKEKNKIEGKIVKFTVIEDYEETFNGKTSNS